SSRRSSESTSSVDSEVILEAERLELERLALKELELAVSKPVAFSVRTNISFDGALYGLDAPSPSRVVSFGIKDFLHIKKRFNQDWWIGRVVRIGSPIGFIPSPSKLEVINNIILSAIATAANTNVVHFANEIQNPTTKPDHRGPTLTANRQRQSESPPVHKNWKDVDAYDEDDLRDTTQTVEVPGQPTAKKPQPVGPGVKKRPFSKKNEFVPPYEIVPCMRPVVFVGPALKGYEVTDMMQKAIFDAMKKHFDGRIIVSRVSTNISLAKRVGELLHLDKKNIMEKGRSRQLVSLIEVQQDLERIFHLGSKMQLLLLDCDTINHPNQITKTCLAPIVIYIKIASIRVLNRLIKNRGKLQKKNAGVQTAAAEKLLQCSPESFDYVIDQNTLSAATEALSHFLEGYWAATHPPLIVSKAERLLGSFSAPVPETKEVDSDRPLVPMTPGHPGLSVVTKSALSAGFTSQEISELTGARATGWLTENGGQVENELGLTGVHHAGSVGSEFHNTHFGGRKLKIDHNNSPDGLNTGHFSDDENEGSRSNYPRTGRLHVGAASAAAIAAVAAGLTPKVHSLHPSLFHGENKRNGSVIRDINGNTTHDAPGLTMGLGLGIANGVAATISAALFPSHNNTSHHQHHSAETHHQPTSRIPPPTIAAAAVASVVSPPLKDLGIHQVEGSDGTQVYQSRSARQAKQREEQLARVKQEVEAKALALQATAGGRRKRRDKERRQRNLDGYWDSHDERYHNHGTNDLSQHSHQWNGPPVRSMARACPPDD
ncbi:voltage-dependent calcium channel beta-2, partial [Schistosoma bovis]